MSKYKNNEKEPPSMFAFILSCMGYYFRNVNNKKVRNKQIDKASKYYHKNFILKGLKIFDKDPSKSYEQIVEEIKMKEG